ncbi:hypothetical protein GCM10017673_09110 [Streptosporangium violaceochromogenes]|nr:hypothetical protein GCM10017673_09110 [Streptosporangium violaceochromogenes]
MPLALFGKRHTIVVPDTRLGHMKARMSRAADLASERVGPMALQARDAAGHARETAGDRLFHAREWAAPKLDAAAQSVEEQIAPRVSALLSQAACKVDPKPRVTSRRWPTLLLFTGLAVGAIGFALYRKSTDQWTESMKESASDASRWATEKARAGAEKVSEVTGDVTSKVGGKAHEQGQKAEHRADETTRKPS